MKTKIIGIFVIMLLIATTLPTVGTMIKYEQPEEHQLSIYIEIVDPQAGWLYVGGNPIQQFAFLSRAFILGPITFQVNINSTLPIECVDWYVDGTQEEQYTSSPYDWYWGFVSGFPGMHNVEVEVIDHQSNSASDSVKVFKIF
jgi:hypothetical protein